ncbi:hypothetical protein ESZ50_02425 [Weissella muntiaci]|uniref:YobI-like P-loop NTPase domain-containing protein n=2 Tax=Weissella muntiaci TaxID=2508881 RepID=A0A6C2C9F6_9LACO|nr:hypothetical protein ESZ50_02425 [Weissella muntiaci]
MESLAPRSVDTDTLNRYKDIMNDALENDSIDNIAISGSYGSGKSSIVNSFFEQSAYSKEILRVSLATFNEKDGLNNENKYIDTVKKNDNDDQVIEAKNVFASMINQIIYQIDPNRIPLTRFKVKKGLNKSTKLEILTLALLVGSLFLNLTPYYGNAKVIAGRLSFSAETLRTFFSVLEFLRNIAIVVIPLMLLWNILANIEFSKISLLSKYVKAELSLAGDDLFEKYADEMRYIFERSKKRILVIEDLDRFEDLSIFTKLRELNIKLNAKRVSGQKSMHWQFVYLIRDTMFTDPLERVKFFDLIIPVVPYISTGNSYEKIRTMFPKVSFRLATILGEYISDYRLLQNIKNEFEFYYNFSEFDKYEELLSLISFKNLFPAEFDVLQNGKGILAEIVKGAKRDATDTIIQLQHDKQEITLKNWDINNNGNLTDKELENLANRVKTIDLKINETRQKRLSAFDFENFESKGFKINVLLKTLVQYDFITFDYLKIINNYYGKKDHIAFLQNLNTEGSLNLDTAEMTDLPGLSKELRPRDYGLKQILNLDYAIWLAKNQDDDEDTNNFKVLINTALSESTDFVENMINKDNSIYSKIIATRLTFNFDLSILNFETLPINVKLEILHKKQIDIHKAESISTIAKWLLNTRQLRLKDLVGLLNDPDFRVDWKHLLLQNSEVKRRLDLDLIDDKNLWPNMLDFNNAKPYLETVKTYSNRFGFDNSLVKFIIYNNINLSDQMKDELKTDNIDLANLDPHIRNQLLTKLK